jgi:hypothetical protein
LAIASQTTGNMPVNGQNLWTMPNSFHFVSASQDFDIWHYEAVINPFIPLEIGGAISKEGLIRYSKHYVAPLHFTPPACRCVLCSTEQ